MNVSTALRHNATLVPAVLLAILGLLLLAAPVAAMDEAEYLAQQYDYVLTIDVTDGTATLADIAVEQHVQWPEVIMGDGSAALQSGGTALAEKQFVLSVIRYAESLNNSIPFTVSNHTVRLRFPYSTTADKVVVRAPAGERSYDIRDFTCRADGSCRLGENALTCPADCAAGQDGICTPLVNGVCDRDCATEDLDCTAVTAPVETDLNSTQAAPPEDGTIPPNSSWKLWVLTVGALLILALVLFLHFYKKARRGDEEHAG